MFGITSVLALFVLLLLSSAVFFLAKRFRIPYTVLLVTVGLLLVPLVQLPYLEPVFGFLDNLTLTPELLFYIFLPMLIFESAFNMNIRKMIESAWPIALLAVVGLLISTVLIATTLYYVLPLVGLPIPFIVALLFGAIISSTDPVAVLALFKEYGAPKRLSLIFEGESLFNDGTAVALFLVLLSIAEHGFHGTETVLEGLGTFLMMVVLGITFGIFMATLFSRALRFTRSNEFVSITVLIVSAHVVFILSELINQNPLFGFHIHVSPIIATTVAALFLGNYARHTLSPKSDEYLEKSIEHLAFIANSLVFLLAGILFASTSVDMSELWAPILVTILVVALARAVAVYGITRPLNKFRPAVAIPSSWEKLLAWGSLRGALAIIIVMLIPDDLVPNGWTYAYTPKELLLALTIGCILATLFIKAMTIGPLIKKLGIDKPTALHEAYKADLGLYYLYTEKARITEQHKRGFVHDAHYHELLDKLETKIQQTLANRAQLSETHSRILLEQSLHCIAINIEEQYLKELYSNTEVSEEVYRKIKGKLSLQQEKIEYAQHEEINPSLYIDRKDVFDRMMLFLQTAWERTPHITPLEDKFQYYRAQSIIARKVVKTLTHMQTQYGEPVFDETAFKKVIDTYERHRQSSLDKTEQMITHHRDELSDFTSELSMKSLHSSGNKALNFFQKKGMADETMIEEIERSFSL